MFDKNVSSVSFFFTGEVRSGALPYCTDTLMPSVPISCLPPRRMDPKFRDWNLSQVVLGRPRTSSNRQVVLSAAANGNNTMMVILGSRMSKVTEESQPEWRPSPTLVSRYTVLQSFVSSVIISCLWWHCRILSNLCCWCCISVVEYSTSSGRCKERLEGISWQTAAAVPGSLFHALADRFQGVFHG